MLYVCVDNRDVSGSSTVTRMTRRPGHQWPVTHMTRIADPQLKNTKPIYNTERNAIFS